MRRADFCKGTIAALSAFATPLIACSTGGSIATFAQLEKDAGGRLGVHAVDLQSANTLSYRADERFAMCSTFKVLAVGAVLSRVDRGEERLGRHVAYTQTDLVEYSPIARQHVGQGFMTLGALCAAASEYSDNTAANLLLRELGGPPGVTRFARSIGDPVTTLNRTEPALNSAIPGDPRDTTTPAAMAADLHDLVLGSALSAASRSELTLWLRKSRTGEDCLRAGLPSSWIVGDKTGLGGRHNPTGDSDTRNDIAVVWPPNRAPLIVAAYLTGSQLPAAKRDGILASVARTVVKAFGST